MSRRSVVALYLLATVGCTSGPPAPDESITLTQIEEYRAVRQRFMLEDPESPVPAAKRDLLLPLRFYPPDLAYVASAALRVARDRPVVEMPTSTGTLRRMERVGLLEFTLQGQPMTLAAFVEEGQALESLFVPFADTTTGTETYSAGRYLDIPPTATGLYTIDFNAAYNPSCAYSEKYECPFPPPSNRLKIAIRAGEKAPGA